MRIIHTSDWHLGSKLYDFDRTEELFAQVDQICRIVEEQDAKVLLIVGDIFERLPRPRLHEVTEQLAEKIKLLVNQQRHVILVPGNHDYRDHFRLMKSLLELEKGQAERVHVVQSCDELEIDGVQFSIIPYPERELLEGYGGERTEIADKIEKGARNTSLSVRLADMVRDVTARLNPEQPSVFVTHIQVEGVTTPNGEKELTYREDITLSKKSLPLNVSYIALGHIHQCQKIKHVVPCWYSGSFDRMNMGERKDEKKVLLVEVEDTGPAQVTAIPIEATPFDEINVTSDMLEAFAETYAERERAYVRINIECTAKEAEYESKRLARQLFNRCLDVQCTGEYRNTDATSAPINTRDYDKTVADWLDQFFKNETKEQRAELKKRAALLVKEVDDALTAN